MATGPQQKRKELREKRLQAEAKAKGGDRRQNMVKIVGIAAFIAVIGIVVAAFALSSGGSDTDSKGTTSSEGRLEGLEQNGMLLGNPKAKVTLVEFGDLQCPVCAEYAEKILPDVFSGPVKAGKANVDYKNWAILGEGSKLAAKAAIAAGEQDRGWSFIEEFYGNQGIENSGYVTDDFLTDIAEKAGVKDIDKWNTDREAPAVEKELLNIDNLATQQGFTGTPSFAVKDSKGEITPITDTRTPQAIIDAINKAQ